MSNDLDREIEDIKRIEGKHKKRKHIESDIRNDTENDIDYIDDEEKLNEMERSGFGLYNYKCPCDQVGTEFDINEHNKMVEEQKQVFKDVKNFIFIDVDKHEVIYDIPMEAFFDNVFDEYNHVTKLCANKNADIIVELHNGQRMPFDAFTEESGSEKFFGKIGKAVKKVINKVVDTMDSVLEKFDIKGIFNSIWDKIKNIGESILKPIGKALNKAMTWLIGKFLPVIIKIINACIVEPFIAPVVKRVFEPVKNFVIKHIIPLYKIIIVIALIFVVFWFVPSIFERLGFWLVNFKIINNTVGRLLIFKPESVKIMQELYSIQSKLDSLTKGDKVEGEENKDEAGEENKDEAGEDNKEEKTKEDKNEEQPKEEQPVNETKQSEDKSEEQQKKENEAM